MTDGRKYSLRYSVQAFADGQWRYINSEGQLVDEHYSEWDDSREWALHDAKMLGLAHGHKARVVSREVSDIEASGVDRPPPQTPGVPCTPRPVHQHTPAKPTPKGKKVTDSVDVDKIREVIERMEKAPMAICNLTSEWTKMLESALPPQPKTPASTPSGSKPTRTTSD